jgi:small subunit ribosomal protein S24e
MAVEILKKEIKNNPLLHRDELCLTIAFNSAVPSKNELLGLIKSQFNAEEACIDIDKIKSRFGKKEVVVFAYIYESPEWMKKIKKKVKSKEKKEGEGKKEGKAKEEEKG